MIFQTRTTGGCFWIDANEVAVGDYGKFLASSPGSQSAECSTNTVFMPGCATEAGAPDTKDPVTCVNWCAAKAYCDWAGKRLCLGDGLFNPKDATKSEWYAACSTNGANTYPYGQSFQPNTCNGSNNSTTGCTSGSCSLVEVGTLTGCHTANGVFDMSGNAAEWVDECDSNSASAMCATRGGGYADDSSGVQCEQAGPLMRLTANKYTGFRCCASP
jgi:formylglycine-generating enzyme required for sulfatase activity